VQILQKNRYFAKTSSADLASILPFSYASTRESASFFQTASIFESGVSRLKSNFSQKQSSMMLLNTMN
jgi:hypothetical protein